MTSRLILSLYYRSPVPPNPPGVGEGVRGVLVDEECEVDKEWEVGETLVVVSSVTWSGDIWW